MTKPDFFEAIVPIFLESKVKFGSDEFFDSTKPEIIKIANSCEIQLGMRVLIQINQV